MKFGSKTSLNILNLMEMFTFFWIRPERPFLGKIFLKNWKTNLKIVNTMVISNFSDLTQENPFSAVLVKKKSKLLV